MRSLMTLAALCASALAFNDTSSLDVDPTKIGFVIKDNITIKAVSTYSKSTSLQASNTSTSLGDTNINFSSNGFTFIGRTTTGSPVPRLTLSSLLETTVLGTMRTYRQTLVISSLSPTYDHEVKRLLTFTRSRRPWVVSELIDVLTDLKAYLIDNGDPAANLALSISNRNGLRASLSIAVVPHNILESSYEGFTPGERNTVQSYFYTNDVAPQGDGPNVLQQAVTWIIDRPPQQIVQPGFEKDFTSGHSTLTINAPSIASGAADVNFYGLYYSATILDKMVREGLQGRWTAFTAYLGNHDDIPQGFFQFLPDSLQTELSSQGQQGTQVNVTNGMSYLQGNVTGLNGSSVATS